MLDTLQRNFSPIHAFQHFGSYVLFIVVAYHKVLLSSLGVGESSAASAAIATKDLWHQPVVERIGFALIWGTMGMLAVAFIWLIVNGLNEISNARSLTRDYANVRSTNKQIYGETIKHIAAGFSPLLIFPICANVLLPMSYRLAAGLATSVNGQSVTRGLVSAIIGTLAFSMLSLSVKLMRTAFS